MNCQFIFCERDPYTGEVHCHQYNKWLDVCPRYAEEYTEDYEDEDEDGAVEKSNVKDF